MVYGVFSGCYSDWRVHGYFKDKVEAEKYCAKKNLHEYESDEDYSAHDSYYVIDILDLLNEKFDTSDVKLRYYHEVVFDFEGGMREEPDRYSFYMGTPKAFKGQYNLFRNNDGWVAFAFDCENREKAERIAQDNYAMFMNLYHESGSYEMAAQSMGINKLR